MYIIVRDVMHLFMFRTQSLTATVVGLHVSIIDESVFVITMIIEHLLYDSF